MKMNKLSFVLIVCMFLVLPSVMAVTDYNITQNSGAFTSLGSGTFQTGWELSNGQFFTYIQSIERINQAGMAVPYAAYGNIEGTREQGTFTSIINTVGTLSNFTRPFFLKPNMKSFIYQETTSHTNGYLAYSTFPVTRLNTSNFQDINWTASTSTSGPSENFNRQYSWINISFYNPYRPNNLILNYYDEMTGTWLGGNSTGEKMQVDVLSSDGIYHYANTTLNDNFLLVNATSSTYIISSRSNSGTNYLSRQYVVTVNETGPTIATIYMLNATTTQTTTMNVIDASGSALADAIVTQEKIIGGTYTIVASCITDVAGQCDFLYNTGDSYRFTVTLTGYSTKVFLTNPILSSNYNIPLQQNSTETIYSGPFSGVSVQISPSYFQNNTVNNFTYQISSPSGKLSSYHLRVNGSGLGDNGTQGSNAYGENLQVSLNVTNATASSVLSFYYDYSTITNESYNYTVTIPVRFFSDGTFAKAGADIYGLTYWERIIIVTILVIICSAIASWAGGVVAGSVMAMFILGYMVAISMISIWIAAPTIIFLFIVAVRYSG